VLEVGAAVRWTVCDRRQREIGEHVAHRPVDRLRAALAPGGDALRDAPSRAAQLSRLAQPPPGLLRRRQRPRPLEERRALLLRPLQAATACQLGGDHVFHRDQVGDVVRGVLQLLGTQRSPRPVGELVAFFEANAEHLFRQRDERRRRHAEKARRELGVEHARRHGSSRALEHLEILIGGVDHRDGVLAKELRQRHEIDCERIDHRDTVLPGELHERQLREVRALAVELGVDRVVLDAVELDDQALEVGVGVDETDNELLEARGPTPANGA
jgi:hypothetical protein